MASGAIFHVKRFALRYSAGVFLCFALIVLGFPNLGHQRLQYKPSDNRNA
jgi:hypothetical protein